MHRRVEHGALTLLGPASVLLRVSLTKLKLLTVLEISRGETTLASFPRSVNLPANEDHSLHFCAFIFSPPSASPLVDAFACPALNHCISFTSLSISIQWRILEGRRRMVRLPYLTALTTLFSYGLLFAFGQLRDFFRKLIDWSKSKSKDLKVRLFFRHSFFD